MAYTSAQKSYQTSKKVASVLKAPKTEEPQEILKAKTAAANAARAGDKKQLAEQLRASATAASNTAKGK